MKLFGAYHLNKAVLSRSVLLAVCYTPFVYDGISHLRVFQEILGIAVKRLLYKFKILKTVQLLLLQQLLLTDFEYLTAQDHLNAQAQSTSEKTPESDLLLQLTSNLDRTTHPVIAINLKMCKRFTTKYTCGCTNQRHEYCDGQSRLFEPAKTPCGKPYIERTINRKSLCKQHRDSNREYRWDRLYGWRDQVIYGRKEKENE